MKATRVIIREIMSPDEEARIAAETAREYFEAHKQIVAARRRMQDAIHKAALEAKRANIPSSMLRRPIAESLSQLFHSSEALDAGLTRDDARKAASQFLNDSVRTFSER